MEKARREGGDMAHEIVYMIQYDESTSTKRATTTLTQELLLNKLENQLKERKESVVGVFQELRWECCGPLYLPLTTSK